jgi:Fic family protein
MENYKPPYTITNKIMNLSTEIMEKIGAVNYAINLNKNKMPELRRKSMINSIHSSLAIEKNELSVDQVKSVINGKLVMGKAKDIQEVKNAYKAYELMEKINPYNEKNLKKIQGIMTEFIEQDNGQYRNHSEGVFDGDIQIFVAPSEQMVPELMGNLFDWLNREKQNVNPLILSSVFHYEFVFIHPFSDGNGRTARYWQSAILSHWKNIFEYIPIETMIKRNQNEYYKAIYDCNQKGDSTEFIEFMLTIIKNTVDETLKEQKDVTDVTENVTDDTIDKKIIEFIKKNNKISGQQMADNLKITRRTIQRHLNTLKEKGVIERIGSDRTGYWKILKQ